MDRFDVSSTVNIVNKLKVQNFNKQTLLYSENMLKLLESGKHSDVVLVVDGTKFPAHKNLLCAQSPVFAAMFDHDNTKEAQEGKVEIVDVPKDVFQMLLNYIYSGTISDFIQTAELLIAADKVIYWVVELLDMSCRI